MDAARMQKRDIKPLALKLLQSRNFDEALHEMKKLPGRKVINALLAYLCHEDENIKWRSVIAMGLIVARLAEDDIEAGRTILRRLIWNLNDESGNIAWGSPEAMAEIMAQREDLAGEFAHILVSFIMPDGLYLEHEPLQRGAVWGIGRLAEIRPDLLREAAPCLSRLLDSGDPGVRGLAARALGLIGEKSAAEKLKNLSNDEDQFDIYKDGGLSSMKVREAAKEALDMIGPDA